MEGWCYTKHGFAIISLTFLFCNFFLLIFVASSSQPTYQPTDNIVLACGSSTNLNRNGETRTWVGDAYSKSFPPDLLQNSASITADAQSFNVPYTTARLSQSPYTYVFSLSPGHKFVRLYFYSATYKDFDRSKAVFSVKAGIYTLLFNFNASVNADASSSFEIFRKFCIYVEGYDRKLNITFDPANHDSYAFVNGIEIVSMPMNLYYTWPDPHDQGGRGIPLIDETDKLFPIENYTALQMLHRQNIGGHFISPVDDTGMFRTWSADTNLLWNNWTYDARPTNLSIKLNYTKISPYAAPDYVYRTAESMGPNTTENKKYNLTWEYSVDSGFFYMIRLHFCEFEREINSINDRVFLIYIGDTIAESRADVIKWAGGKGVPYYKDYALYILGNSGENRVNLSIVLQADPNEYETRFTNAILNGIEIFKLNQSNSSLAGPNPNAPPTKYHPQSISLQIPQSKSRKMVVIISTVVGVLVAMLVMGLFVSRRCKVFIDQQSSDGTSRWASMSTQQSSKSRTSNLPSDLCRYFSLEEIRTATKNFDDGFVIGIGGFGNVYKGYLDDGTTQVAVKRLKPGSKQGENEFKTEIEMLSQLRHVHLVSLIGYCNENNEMILVYDYMTHGTLRNQLINNEKPLTWKQRLHICIGTAKGLQYLHTGTKQPIIHRDVKTTNILLDENWVAKVSDFGLSKFGLASMSKAHVSTVVKGSFGYLDPEYCRRQQLTDKSDVYSFGVVLCEVLCAHPALIRTKDEITVLLAELVRRGYREKTVDEMIDPNIKNEIAPECFKKFIEMVVCCIQNEGSKRPSMNDVVWGLEFALQLQESPNKEAGNEFSSTSIEEGWLLREALSSDNNTEVGTSSSQSSCFVNNKGMSGIVFSELQDLQGR